MLLNEKLNIKYPVFQGAMANISDGKFAASVSNAGAVGIIASGDWDADKLREEIRICKSLTNNVFGVNLMLMNPNSAELVKVICEEKVKVVTTGAGNPTKYIPKLKEAGCMIFPVIPSAALAKRMEAAGADGVVAEGTESGGHVGELTTMVLVASVCEAVNIPVIAAGGISNGKQLNAAFALGACGVQVGTMMLATKECPIHDNYKEAVVNAKDTDTTVAARSFGIPVRILKNEMAKQYPEFEKQCTTRDELEEIAINGLKKASIDGDVANGCVMMGQTAGLIKEVKTVEDVLKDLFEDSLNEQVSLLNKLEDVKKI